MKELIACTAAELSRQLKQRRTTSLEITKAFLAQISRRNPEINAFLSILEEDALREAAASDARYAEGKPLSPLDGVPVALKDNIVLKDHPCTCASRMLEHFIPPYDATVTLRLRAAGLPILGKLNMDEFAMGGSNETSYFGPVRNPSDVTRVAGGSSGGAAAAVAARMTPLALGSDTGGSIRQPASFCGITGVKPSYGTVSRYGLIAFASSLDQIGPLAHTARDAAMLLDVIAGPDERDMTSRKQAPDTHTQKLGLKTLEGVTLGLIAEGMDKGLDGTVRKAVLETVERLKQMGATVETVHLPSLSLALPAYYVLSSAEASSNLARYDGVRYGHRAESCETLDELYRKSREEGFGEEVKRRILLGTFALSSGYQDQYYLQARRVREGLTAEARAALKDCDALLSPVAPTPAYPLGEKTRDPMAMYLGDVFTVPANITGLAALSTPCRVEKGALPVGLSLMGEKLPLMLGIADALERGEDE